MKFSVLFILCMCGVSIAQTTEPPIDIPQVTGIAIDGKGDDWADHGLHLDALAPADGNLLAHVDNISARLGWDERGLLVFLTVHQAADPQHADHEHSVELFLSRADTIDRFRVQVSGDATGMKATTTDNRQMMADRAKPIETSLQTSITDDGYTVEALLPWKNLNVQPAAGLQMRTEIRVNVTDADGQKTQYRWHAGASNYTRSMLFIRLAKEPSPPIELAAEGRYERLQRIRIGVIGASKLAGKSVDVLDGDHVIGSGTLAANGIASSVALIVPMPPRGHPYGKLSVRAGNDAQVNLDFQDPQSAQGNPLNAELVRSEALDADPILFKPFVFSGEKFPSGEFQDPVTADECLGPYTLRTTFYDANFNEVKMPTAPGRYGAVVEVRSEETGKSFKRFCTLFKTSGKIDWAEVKLPDGLQLPQGLGLSAGVIEHQSREIHYEMDHALDESMLRDPETAVSLTGLFETAPDAPPWLERQEAAERDRQWWYRLHQKIGDAVPLKYLAYMPKGYEADPSKKWPLILSLHGAGERGDDLNMLKIYGIPMLCEQGKDDSYIAICPQLPQNQSWLAMQLNDLLDEVCKKYRVDPDRIVVTGASMGGVGAWSLVQQYPDRFAAIVPVCGHGDTADVDRIKNLPVWIFHGEVDPVVPVAKERAMADALSKLGNHVKMSIYPGVGHECWNQAWATPEVIPWMLQQKHGAPTTQVDSQ